MAVYRLIDSHIISEEEYATKGLGRQLALRNAGEAGDRITLGNSAVLNFTESNTAPQTLDLDGNTPLPPIGFGLPMNIDIRHVYTGNVGVKNIDGTGDIAVVSGVKDWSVFKASTRALNFVATRKAQHSDLTGPGALTDGTRVIAYQKAVIARQVILTVEITAAGKEDGIFTQLGNAFTAAAGIPLLMPYAGILLAAGELVPVAGKLANSLFGTPSPWSQTAEINFDMPGTKPSTAEKRLIASAGADFSAYTFDDTQDLLVDRTGRAAYPGEEPYMVVAIYGGANPDLESFTPAVAGADLLKRFYQAQQDSGAVLDELVEVMKVASDVKFRDAALAIKALIDTAPPGSDTTQLKSKFDATVANIGNPALRPTLA